MAEVLGEYLKAQAAEPFVYGASDCSTFVVGWFDRVTGRNALAKWRGKFYDKETCEAFIVSHGGFRDIAGVFFAQHYGIDPAPPAVGNVVLARLLGITAMGIRVSLDGQVALRQPAGLVVTKRAAILEEWGPPCRPS